MSVSKATAKCFLNDEPIASIVQEALEGNVPFQLAQNMLRRSLYAGYIDVKKWDISLHPAKHEPLISFETRQRIQNRLNEKPQAPTRKDLNEGLSPAEVARHL